MKFDEYFKLRDVTINVTNGCDLNCRYCFEDHKSNKKMSCENVAKIIDKCYANYLKNDNKQPFMVNFFGGEPFTNWEVIEYALKYSRGKGYKIEFGVTTNLTILTDHMIDIIEEYELGMLVSIDGVPEIHNRNRCNSYALVKNNVKRLVERHLGYLLEARMTVMPKDTPLLLDSVKSIVEMGIVNIAPVPVTDTIWTKADLEVFKDNLDKLWQWLFDIYNDNDNKKNISIKCIEDYLEKVLTYESIPEQTELCLAGSIYNCSIGVDGDIMPCHQRHTVSNRYKELVMGNIFLDDDIKTVDFNDFTRNAEEDCSKCLANHICKGGCPSENLSINGYGNIMNKNQCNVLRAMVEVAIKYQHSLLNCSNLRSRRLITIKENIELLEYFKKEIVEKSLDMQRLVKFYEMLMDKEVILLPLFNNAIRIKVEELININRQLLRKKDGGKDSA